MLITSLLLPMLLLLLVDVSVAWAPCKDDGAMPECGCAPGKAQFLPAASEAVYRS